MSLKKKYILLAVLIGILTVTGISYAVWQLTKNQEGQNIVNSACFKIEFEEENNIELQNAYPIIDEEGKKQKPYTFTITNICNTYVSYQVNLEVLKDTTLSSNYIKTSLEGLEPRVLGSITKTKETLENTKEAYVLTTGYLTKGKSATYNLRLWMDYDTPPNLDTMNKTFQSKITIVSTQVSEIENQITNQVISLNEGYAKEEKFEIHVTSEVVDIVETSIDNKTWNKLETTGKEVVIETKATSSGEHTIYVKDAANNIFMIPFQANKVDDIPPFVEAKVLSDIKKITIDASESRDIETKIKNYYYSLDEENWHCSPENKYTFENLENKEYTFYIKVEDEVGNVSEIKEVKGTPEIAGTDYISNISNEEQLVYDGTVDNNLRYVGANPDNYVSFNNELWRIIGVMNNMDDGEGNLASRIKLVKSSPSHYNTSLHSSIIGNWANMNFKNTLNTSYLNSINEESRKMIDTVSWKLGGGSNYDGYAANAFYNIERGNTFAPWVGKIALLYPSDYGFATGGSVRQSCLNATFLSYTNNRSCADQNWIELISYYKRISPWTMTPYKSSKYYYLYYFSYDGLSGVYQGVTVSSQFVIIPTFYLNPNVKIISGTGTSEDPFKLKL